MAKDRDLGPAVDATGAHRGGRPSIRVSLCFLAGLLPYLLIVSCLALRAQSEPEVETVAEPASQSGRAERRGLRRTPPPDTESRGMVRIEGLDDELADEAGRSIADEIAVIEQQGATMARADDAAYFLELWLLERGFPDARVEWRLPDEETVILAVEEGTRRFVGMVAIDGGRLVSEENVRAVLLDETRQRLGLGGDDPVPLVAADIEVGANRLRQLYRLSGFVESAIDVTIDDGANDPGQADVRVRIRPGRRFTIARVTPPEIPDDPGLGEAVRSALAEYQGSPFSRETGGGIERRISEIAVDHAYLSAVPRVRETGRREAGIGEVEVDLAVDVEWGSAYVVGGFTVSGEEQVRDRYFEDRFGRFVGERYSHREVERSVNRMLRTGAFQRVTAEPSLDGVDPGQVTLAVEVEEAKSIEVGIYGGYGSYEGAIVGFQYRDLNLFGLVRRLDTRLEYNQRGGSGQVRYDHPDLFGFRQDLSIEAIAQTTEHEGYSKWEVGPRTRLVRTFGERDQHEISVFSRLSLTDVHEFEIEEALLGETRYVAHEIGASIAYDERDDPLNPRSGVLARLSAGVASGAIGSEVDFTRLTGILAWHVPVGSTTLRLGARAGVISPIGGTEDIPIDLRYFSGGSRSVRSFRERDLGPRDESGYPVGGEFFSTYTVEYEVPVWKALNVAAFADAGNLLTEAGDAGFDDMHYAAGLGLRYRLPIGPLRVDYGWNLNRGEHEPSGSLHIGFGFSF